jgi:glutathione synthase/RimK-type ligase-like ATP-grasp enzyme
MGLTSGSIDLMLASNGDYYFLEVNPTGQIGWVSDFGNYCLEEKIAQYLLKKEKVFIYERTTTPAG